LIQDFLVVCNLLKIFKDKDGKIEVLKEYSEAKSIIDNL
jgi:hypothetical protein